MNLIKVNDYTWVNPQQVAYVVQGDEDSPWDARDIVYVVMVDGSRHVAQGSLMQVVEAVGSDS